MQDRSALESIVRGCLGPTAALVGPVAGGYLNHTYLVQHEGQEWVLWVNTSAPEEDKAGRQAAMLSRLSAAGLPVPRLAGWGREPCGYVLTERLPGQNLEGLLPHLEAGHRRQLLFQLGQLLARIHKAGRLPFSGHLGETGPRTERWRDWFRMTWSLHRAEAERAVPDDACWEAIDALVERLEPQLEAEHGGVLLHGDFYPGNVLGVVGDDGVAITGLLDFEWALAGDPAYDLRVMEVWTFPTCGHRSAFYAGYKAGGGVRPAPSRLLLYRVAYHVEMMWAAIRFHQADPQSIQFHLQGLRALLREASELLSASGQRRA